VSAARAAVAQAGIDHVGWRSRTEFVAERDKMPVTLNVARQGSKMWKLIRELADWRDWAHHAAIGLDPVVGQVDVTVVHLRKNRAAMPDTGAPILAAKAVIDGLVRAGVLPGDGPDVVRRLVFEPPLIVGWQGLRVTLTKAQS
jgi:Fe2+ transport system protein FeoA